MKKQTMTETQTENNQEDTKLTKEWINRTLKKIHREMVELFHIDFTYFRDIKIIKQSEVLKQLTKRMRNNLEENGVIYNDIQWKQIRESLSKNRVTDFLENLAFYNPKDDVLCMSEKMITNHPEKIIPICTHELSEKLLLTHLSTPPKTPARAMVEAYIEAKKIDDARKLYELLSAYTDVVFKNVFKEGCCEAIAFQTLRRIGYEKEVASLEKELLVGHSKCIDVLFDLDNIKRSVEDTDKRRIWLSEQRQGARVMDEGKILKEILRSSQIIKGCSYYLGYPLAKAVVEKYGIRGVKLALEKYPPRKARYFADPKAYLAWLEEPVALTEQRR